MIANDQAQTARDFIRQNCTVDEISNSSHDIPPGTSPKDLDFYIVGPPCQQIATGGKRHYNANGRAHLYHAAMERIIIIRPKVAMIENPPNIKYAQQEEIHTKTMNPPGRQGARYSLIISMQPSMVCHIGVKGDGSPQPAMTASKKCKSPYGQMRYYHAHLPRC